MKIHLDELEMASEYARGQAFEDLSSEQTPWISLFKEWCFSLSASVGGSPS